MHGRQSLQKKHPTRQWDEGEGDLAVSPYNQSAQMDAHYTCTAQATVILEPCHDPGVGANSVAVPTK
jgi:hypothetical protein